jgi:tetratricopeptide (TPR) repeat protein
MPMRERSTQMTRDLHTLVSPENDAESLLARGQLALRQGDVTLADALFTRASCEPRMVVRALRLLAVSRIKSGRSEGALTLFIDARARIDDEFHDVDMRALKADLDHRIGHLAHTLSRLDLAERAYRACVKNAERASLVARARHNLGVLLVEEERHDEALPILHRALAERERIFGLGSREVAGTLRELAVVAAETGSCERARALLERALFALGPDERATRARYFSELARLSRATRIARSAPRSTTRPKNMVIT